MKRRQEGQAVVEFAVLVPVLILLLLGVVDVTRMAGAYLVVVHATREGARLAITGAPESEIRNRITGVAETLDQSRLAITVDPAGGSKVSGSDVEVRVVYTYQVMAVSWLIGADVPLTGLLRARVE